MPRNLDRRSFLISGVAASAALSLSPRYAIHEQAVPKRRILAAGGQAFSDPGRVLLRYLISLTGKTEPVVYFLPTASGDNSDQILVRNG